MDEDPIMQELRQVRQRLLQQAGGDVVKLIQRANREGGALWKKYRKTTRRAPKKNLVKKRQTPAFRTAKSKGPVS